MEQEFNIALFEKKLQTLKDSQESINSLSAWCLENRQHHKKIVQCWLNVLKRVKVEHRLTLFYLANDVIQYSKRKNYEFVESWSTSLQKATTMVREEKVKHRVLRIFKIWENRGIYGEEFLSDLSGLISVAPVKKYDVEPSEFQPSYLISKINACTRLEEDTDLKLQKVKENEPKFAQWDDPEAVVASLKDRQRVEDVEKEVDDDIMLIEVVIAALNAEIKARKHLTNLLAQGDNFYRTQRGEVKVVSNAYKNFGLRVKNLKKRLDEMIQDDSQWSSPIPSPDVNAPSPSPDSDIELPEQEETDAHNSYNVDQSYSANFYTPINDQASSFTNNGFTSFMGSNISFDIHANLFSDSNTASHVSDTPAPSNNLIEVVGNQKPSPPVTQPQPNSFSLNNIIKQLLPTTDTNSVPDLPTPNASIQEPYSRPLLPPPLPPFTSPVTTYSSNPPVYTEPTYPPITETYGVSAPNPDYQQMPPYVPPPDMQQPYPISTDDYNPEEDLEIWDNDGGWPEPPDMETPESPPGYEKEAISDPVEYHDRTNNHPLIPSQEDVDHRVLLPPPHLQHLAELKGPDTDHRMIRSANKDIDHRNLISLTGSPGPENTRNALIPPPPLPQTPWQADQDYRTLNSNGNDQDYRSANIPVNQTPMIQHFVNLASEPPPPPPPPPPQQPPPMSVNKRTPSSNLRPVIPISTTPNQDNVESIDMELSDDDNAMNNPKRHSPDERTNVNKRPLLGNTPYDEDSRFPRKKYHSNLNNIPILVEPQTTTASTPVGDNTALTSPPIPPCLDDDVDAEASNILETISQDEFLEGLPEIENETDKQNNSLVNNNSKEANRPWYNNWQNEKPEQHFNIPPEPHRQNFQNRPPLPPQNNFNPNFHQQQQQPSLLSSAPPPPPQHQQQQFRGGLMGHFPTGPRPHFRQSEPGQFRGGLRGRGGGNWNNKNNNNNNSRGFYRGGNRGFPRGGGGRGNSFRGRGRGGFREQW